MKKLEIPNLDAMSADELDTWRESTDPHYPLATFHARRGGTYRMRVAQEYARRKANACRLRLAGDVARACLIEEGCETLYNRLPKADRW